MDKTLPTPNTTHTAPTASPSVEAAPQARSGAAGPAGDRDAEALLLRFLEKRDVPCPRCGYNLRALVHPQCPECAMPLELVVRASRPPPIGIFLVTITPGLFSGVAAVVILLIMTVFGRPPMPVLLVDLFGFASGAGAVILYAYRDRFLAQSSINQWTWAGAAWLLHVGLFALLMLHR